MQHNFSSLNLDLGFVSLMMIERPGTGEQGSLGYVFHHGTSLFCCLLNQLVTQSIMPFKLDILISEQERLSL